MLLQNCFRFGIACDSIDRPVSIVISAAREVTEVHELHL